MKQRIGSVLLTLAMTLALLPAAAVPVRADGTKVPVTTLDALKAAVADANISEIEISGVIEVDNNITVSRSVTFTGNGTLKRADGFPNNNGILYVDAASGVNVVWDGPIIDCNKETSKATCVLVARGNFELRGGALRNGTYGVDIVNGTFTMNGGEISGNTANGNGAGVRVGAGTFTMNDGSISDNSVSGSYGGSGGGVYVFSGTFTMNGGSINGNTAAYYGGGVYVSRGNTFIMNGGSITGNTAAYYGGGVYINGAAFYMNGGGINGNEAKLSGGGGVYLHVESSSDTASFTMNAGAICNNKSREGSGYAGVDRDTSASNCTFTMNGGWIGGNTGNGDTPTTTATGDISLKGGVVGTTSSFNSGKYVEIPSCNTGTTTCTVKNIKASSDLPIDSSEGNTIVNIYGASAVGVDFADDSGDTTHLYNCTLRRALTVSGNMSLYGGTVSGATTVANGGALSLYAGASTTHKYKELAGTTSVGNDCYQSSNASGTGTARNGAVLGSGSDARRTTVGGALAVYDGTLHGGVDLDGSVHAGDGGKLALYGATDGSSGALVTGGKGESYYSRGGGVYAETGAVLVMYGGMIAGNRATNDNGGGGGVYMDHTSDSESTFTMLGGAISYNTDGGVYMNNFCTFDMLGGKIAHNTAKNRQKDGAGVCVERGDNAKLNLSGDASIESNDSNGKGGGVYLGSGSSLTLSGGAAIRQNKAQTAGGGVYSNRGTFAMSGGSITGNQAPAGGGVFVSNFGTTFKLSGAVTIKDNTSDGTIASNVGVLYNNPEPGVITIDGALSKTDPIAPIGVTAYSNNTGDAVADYPVVFTSGWNTYMPDADDIASYFVSDSSSYTVALDEESRELQLQEPTTRTVTFNSDGTVVDSQIVERGEKATRPANPAKSDFAFGGWVLESDGSPYDFSESVTGDITLIAQWVDTAHAHDGATFVPLTRALFVNATTDANSVPVKLNYDAEHELSYYTLAAGDYWLAGDVTLNHTLRIDKAVKLCLNGQTLTQAEDGANAIEIVADGTLDLYDEAGNNGTITHAINEWGDPFPGSGVYIGAGRTFNMHGGTISGNRGYLYLYQTYGGGVYVGENGTFNMSGGAITRNNARNGGGVYIGTDGAFTLSDGGAISENEGGGVYIKGGAFTMTGGAIRENTDGGGVYVEGGAFNMSNGEIYNNTDGGVYVEGGMFTMNDGEIYGHHSTHGGGVYLAGGTFGMTGGKIRDNKVDGAGGGVYVENGTFNLSGGSITGNISYGVWGDGEMECGGGVFVGENGAFNLSGGSITGNISDAGGGVFVDGGGTFTVSGTPSVTGNQAGECEEDRDGGYVFDEENLSPANVGVVQGSSVITVDGLSGAASIGVTVYTATETEDDEITYTPVAELASPLAFTATNEGIESYKSYFSSDQAGRVIVVTDGPALALAPAYTVSYNANGGSGDAPASATVTAGSSVTIAANTFTKTGYTFDGWNTEAGGGGTSYAAGAEVTVSANMTLYAQWTINHHTVTITPSTGIASVTGGGTYDYNASVSISATAATGYHDPTFTVDAGGVTISDNSFTMPDMDVRITASATANTYTVSYNANGGESESAPANQVKTHGEDLHLTSAVPTRDGHIFNGWNTQSDGEGTPYAAGDTYGANEGVTLYAQWKVSHTVTFDSDGGSEVASQTVAEGDTATRPANPTKSGYTFNKWQLDEADYDFSTFVTGDVTLKAVWTANPVLPPAPPSPSSDYTPSAPAAATVTVPVSGDESTVNVTVRVTNGGEATLTSANVSAALDGNDSTGTVAIDLGGLAREISSVTIPAAIVADVAGAVASAENATDSLTVKLTDGSVTFDAAAVESITAQSGGNDLKLNLDGVASDTMNGAQQSAVSGLEVAGVLDVYMTSNNVRISDFGGGSAEVRIPFTAPNGRTAAEYAVWYVAENGAMTNQRARYDAEDACFVFTVTHFSNYVIAYGGCPQDETCPIAAYADANPAAWYHDGVHWAVESGVMSGWEDAVTGRPVFAPDGDTSRAMVAVMLWRLEGEPPADAALIFDDVQAGKWYSDAIRWAAGVGVITGWDDAVTGRPVFAPDDAVTREQLATMLWRYAKYKGADVSVGEDTNILSYGDALDVSEYAIPAMQWACGAGIIGGYDDLSGARILAPRSASSRAVVATMLRRFVELNGNAS